jgi:hypothetical protein
LWVLVSLQPPRVFIQKIAAVTRARSSLNAGLPVPPQIPEAVSLYAAQRADRNGQQPVQWLAHGRRMARPIG